MNEEDKIKILKKELERLEKKINILTKENEKLKKTKDKAEETILVYVKKISLAEESRNEYEKLVKELKLSILKYKSDLKKILN